MIYTDCTVTIKRGEADIDEPIVLYRGDKEIEIKFYITNNPFWQNVVTTQKPVNVINETDCSYGQLIIKLAEREPIFSEITAVNDGAVIFKITGAMIDELEEVGNYDFQIRLMDEDKTSQVTIPTVVGGIEVREPLAIQQASATNEVGIATVNNAVLTIGETLDVFDENGNYIETTWANGDTITDSKLNKIEDGITGVNQKVASVATMIPDSTSDLTNDSGFITADDVPEVDLSGYAKTTDIPTVPTTISSFTNDSGYITSIPDEYITDTELTAKGYATTSQIPTVPTNVSAFTNDANYATETYVDEAIADISIGEGSSASNTLIEKVEELDIQLLGQVNIPTDSAASTYIDTGVTLSTLRQYKSFVIIWKGASNTSLANTYFTLQDTTVLPTKSNLLRISEAGLYSQFTFLNKNALTGYYYTYNPSIIPTTPKTDIVCYNLNMYRGQTIDITDLPDTNTLRVYLSSATTISYDVYVYGLTKEVNIEATNNDILVTNTATDNILTLTTDKYQTATIATGTTIALPTVTSYTEIHLYFATDTTAPTITFPAGKYQKTPSIGANKTYEFIFTYVNSTIGWMIGYIEYA